MPDMHKIPNNKSPYTDQRTYCAFEPNHSSPRLLKKKISKITVRAVKTSG